jgi:hypothetical protein
LVCKQSQGILNIYQRIIHDNVCIIKVVAIFDLLRDAKFS